MVPFEARVAGCVASLGAIRFIREVSIDPSALSRSGLGFSASTAGRSRASRSESAVFNAGFNGEPG